VEASAFSTSSALPGLRGPAPLLRLQSDEKLITLTRRGELAAFEALCSRYHARLLAFCRHMLGSREDAEDVLQEVFAAAFNAVMADSREINARPWLYRIARNRSLNHLRRASAIGVDSMDVHFADHGTSTSDRVLSRESFRELLQDVGQLPETQRTALLLREIDALSYEQIAHAMETTVPSVKSLLVRARISLAEAAEARKLSCEEVRFELGEAAEGLRKLSPPARRHVRDCDRCRSFKRQLRENNQALAAMLPVAPLLLLKKLILAKLGATASAGSAQVAGGASVSAGAGAGALATAGGASAGVGAGSAFTIGAGAVASKAVAGLAAAAIVGAGAVAANRLTVSHPATTHPTHAYVARSAAPAVPVVVSYRAQPATTAAVRMAARERRAKMAHRLAKSKPDTPALAPAVAPSVPAPPPAAATAPEPPPTGTQVTQVTSDTTQLPPEAAGPSVTTTPTIETPAPTTTETVPAVTPTPESAPTAGGPPTPGTTIMPPSAEADASAGATTAPAVTSTPISGTGTASRPTHRERRTATRHREARRRLAHTHATD
jgi:RNA polymerase sigma factor (sigma-70 family)